MPRMSYVEQARLDDPEGAICAECGEPNDHADDCGWFGTEHGALCSNCWDGGGYTTCER